MAQQRSTIEDFGLVRNEEESHYLHEYIYLVPFAGPMTEASEWIGCQIKHPNDTDTWGLHQYAINESKKVYVLFSAFLLSARAPGGRKTDMRLFQMIVANWIDAVKVPDSLRYLGVSLIVNLEVRQLMELEWQYQIGRGQNDFGNPQQRMLTVTRANSLNTWDNNIFVRSGLRVAQSLSTTEKTVTLDRVHLIRSPESEQDFVMWNLVLEFRNGDPGQENYRERLIRKLLPMITHQVTKTQLAHEAKLK